MDDHLFDDDFAFDEAEPEDRLLYVFNDIGLALRIHTERATADA